MTRFVENISQMKKRGACLLLMAGSVAFCEAQSPGVPLQLELPRLDGASFARLSDLPKGLVVLNFWRSDCQPCVEEMPMLSRLSLMHPSVQFVGIATADAVGARRFLDRLTMTYPQWMAPAASEGLMRRFGNKTGALPYTVVVLNDVHQICLAKAGIVDQAWMTQTLQACATKLSH